MPIRFMTVLVAGLAGAGAAYLFVAGRAGLPESGPAMSLVAALSFAVAIVIERER